MKITVVGGTGHVGRFLVPMLVEAGHEVCVIARGVTSQPPGDAWQKVTLVRGSASDSETLAALSAGGAEVVVDIPGTARAIYGAVRGKARHMVAIGSVWMLGDPKVVPTPELTQTACPFEGYAARYAEIQDLCGRGGPEGTPFTAVMPPNICGPGKIPLDCLGGRDIEQHRAHKAGKPVILPDGPEALVGPCDAEDIARCLFLAIEHREQAAGQIFNVGSAYALTWSEFVQAYADIYGRRIPIERVSWQEYTDRVSPGMGWWWHMKAHMCPDIGKARRLLGYEPRHTPQGTLARAVEWMRGDGMI